MKKEKIAAVVVTHNRKELLVQCLDALLHQTYPVDSVYIVDNASTDGTTEYLREQKVLIDEIPDEHNKMFDTHKTIPSPSFPDRSVRINYIRLPENTGGTGGFYEGIKRSCRDGHDWLWLMDDDAVAETNALEELVKGIDLDDVVVLAQKIVNSEGRVSQNDRGITINFNRPFPLPVEPLPLEQYENQYVEIKHCSFVGILIKRDAVKKIGLPKKELFIYVDDIDYSHRLSSVGKAYLVSKSIIIHHQLNAITKSSFGKTSPRTAFNKYYLRYCLIRNLVYISKNFVTNKIVFYFWIVLGFFRQVSGIIFFDEDSRLDRIKLNALAIYHGLRGKLDYLDDIKKKCGDKK